MGVMTMLANSWDWLDTLWAIFVILFVASYCVYVVQEECRQSGQEEKGSIGGAPDAL